MADVGITTADGTTVAVCDDSFRGIKRLLLVPAVRETSTVRVPLTVAGRVRGVLTLGVPPATPAEIELFVQVTDAGVLRAMARVSGDRTRAANLLETQLVEGAARSIDADDAGGMDDVDDGAGEPLSELAAADDSAPVDVGPAESATQIRRMVLSGLFEPASSQRRRYLPPTPVAALRAFEHELVPIEVFTHLVMSAKPMNVEPYDLDLIRFVLAQKDLALDTTLLVMNILRVLVNDKDLEVALFAAEAMNTIEGRQTDRIEQIRRGRDEVSGEDCIELMRLFYRLALLQDSPAIRRFYMWEAFVYLKEVNDYRELEDEDFTLLVRIMAAVDLHELALIALEERIAVDPSFRLLQVEIEFGRHDYRHLVALLADLRASGVRIDATAQELMAYWSNE